jgi:hypothetical protein
MNEAGLKANKALCIVRNPYDIVLSLFNQAITFTHDRELSHEEIRKFHEAFKIYAKSGLKLYKIYHERLIEL